MDEVQEFCRCVLGSEPEALQAAAEVQARPAGGRIELLAAAAHACRALASEDGVPVPVAPEPEGDTLAVRVAAELERANSQLPERQREALALREALRLSYEQIAAVMGVDAAAVAPLLARARLRLREARRDTPPTSPKCSARDRSLRALACRQDAEALSADEHAWVLEHLGACEECSSAHAAMLEASVCYRVAR